MKQKLLKQMSELLYTFEKVVADDEEKFTILNTEICKLQSICNAQQDKLYYLEDQLNEQKEKDEKMARILTGDEYNGER